MLNVLAHTTPARSRSATARIREPFSVQIPADSRGLIVTDVTPGGPSWEVLFDDPQRGGPDIILSVEGREIAEPLVLPGHDDGDHPHEVGGGEDVDEAQDVAHDAGAERNRPARPGHDP